MDYFAHETAVVDAGAAIGRGTRIWHFVHVSGSAIIGADCVLGQNVYVAEHVTIGDNVRIQNNVSVFEGVTLEDEVFCGPSTVFTNVINPRADVSRKDEFLPTLVRRGASLGANCTIVCGNTVGAYAFIGAGTVVTHDVVDYALIVGVPGRQVGWMSRNGERLDIAADGDGEASCPTTGDRYRVSGGCCRLLDA
ncbi:MAG: acyltransferase [Pseudomonadales bacterium]